MDVIEYLLATLLSRRESFASAAQSKCMQVKTMHARCIQTRVPMELCMYVSLHCAKCPFAQFLRDMYVYEYKRGVSASFSHNVSYEVDLSVLRF